jgi:hypothetical protein
LNLRNKFIKAPTQVKNIVRYNQMKNINSKY